MKLHTVDQWKNGACPFAGEHWRELWTLQGPRHVSRASRWNEPFYRLIINVTQDWLIRSRNGLTLSPKDGQLRCQVKAKILSLIFVLQIGHSEQAREHDLHTAVILKIVKDCRQSCCDRISIRKITYSKNDDMAEA